MRGKVIVRDGEDIGQALKRLRREVCRDRELDKWPVWAGHYAKPSEKKGPRAAKLQLIDRMPGGILSQPPQELAPRHHPKARQRKATWKRRIDVQGKPAGS